MNPAGLLLAEVLALSSRLRRRSRRCRRSIPERARKLHGVEVFPGLGTPFSRTTRYGATFVAAESGGAIMLGWVNYTPIFFKPDTECTVVGGRWFILLRKRREYPRILRGSFTDGVVIWNYRADMAHAVLSMKVSAGARGSRGGFDSGTLVAGLNHLPFPPMPPSIRARLELVRSGTRKREYGGPA